jgi:hypothetical protein
MIAATESVQFLEHSFVMSDGAAGQDAYGDDTATAYSEVQPNVDPMAFSAAALGGQAALLPHSLAPFPMRVSSLSPSEADLPFAQRAWAAAPFAAASMSLRGCVASKSSAVFPSENADTELQPMMDFSAFPPPPSYAAAAAAAAAAPPMPLSMPDSELKVACTCDLPDFPCFLHDTGLDDGLVNPLYGTMPPLGHPDVSDALPTPLARHLSTSVSTLSGLHLPPPFATPGEF